MFSYIALAIIVASLAVILFIVFRRLPQASNLDVQELPEEKETQKKNEILTKRIEEQGKKVRAGWSRKMEPLRRLWGKFQLRFRVYVGKVERLWHHEQTIKTKTEDAHLAEEEREQKLAKLIQEAEEHLKNNNLEKAEGLFIAAVKMDSKATSAYRGLGDTYLAQNALDEARQTYRFVLKLEPDDDNTLVKLAEMAERQGDVEEAIEYYEQAVVANDALSPRFYHLGELLLKVDQPTTAKEAVLQAVELEPKNPKYLDLLIETAIICGDKDLALKGYNDLRLVNAENQKLVDFKERISQM